MMGKEYFTVAGYLTDGAVLCRDCGEKQALPASAQITEAQARADYANDGLNCDACFAEIVPATLPEDEDEVAGMLPEDED
jgi:hypothetical protein